MTTRCWSPEICHERTDVGYFCATHLAKLMPALPAADAQASAGDDAQQPAPTAGAR